jgi:hypothetical protein
MIPRSQFNNAAQEGGAPAAMPGLWFLERLSSGPSKKMPRKMKSRSIQFEIFPEKQQFRHAS